MPAVLFGSISALADTSEVQRQAFNEAFAAHDLDWHWSRDDYASMLDSNGGAQRIADYATSRGEDVDAAAVHKSKSTIFQRMLSEADVSARPGVLDTIEAAKAQGVRMGFVTTTSRDNISALLSALAPRVGPDTFDLIVDVDSVDEAKPNAAAYLFALQKLGQDADESVAIEDNPGGVTAADAAGIRCVAFPNENTVDGDFAAAAEKVSSLDAAHILELVTARS